MASLSSSGSVTLSERIQDFVTAYLEDYTLEDLLEEFNVTPEEAFLSLYNSGMIDEDLVRRLAYDG